MGNYRTLADHRVSVELEIRRSRFIAWLTRARDESAARALIDEARRSHPTARHHCSAFIVPSPGVHDTARSSDDGEPAGTAGAPMLDALRGSGLREVAAVVIRYFGGVKLGTGGLVKAYGEAVSSALDAAALVEVSMTPTFTVTVSHAEAGRIEAMLRTHGHQVVGVFYAESAMIRVGSTNEEGLVSLVGEATGGMVTPVAAQPYWTEKAISQ